MKIRFGLIGFGRHMSEKLIPALKKFPEVELVYGACRTQRTLDFKKTELQIQEATTNWIEMMSKDKIDAVIVAATPQVHEMVAKKAIKSGIHVFIEKPLSLSIRTMHEIAALSALHPHVVTAEGFNFQYVGMMKPYKYFENHQKPLSLSLHCAASGPQTPIWGTGSVSNSFLYAVLIHPLSVAWHLYGKPADIQLSHFAFDGTHLSGDIQLAYPDQIVRLDFNNYAKRFEFRIHLTDCEGKIHDIDASTNTYEKTCSYEAEFKEFTSAILDGAQPRNNFIYSVAIHQMLAQIKQLIAAEAATMPFMALEAT